MLICAFKHLGTNACLPSRRIVDGCSGGDWQRIFLFPITSKTYQSTHERGSTALVFEITDHFCSGMSYLCTKISFPQAQRLLLNTRGVFINEHGLTRLPRSLIYICSTSNTKHPLKIWNVSALLPPKIKISFSVIQYASPMQAGTHLVLSTSCVGISCQTFLEMS